MAGQVTVGYAKLKLDVPFDYEEYPYTDSVRLHYRGFYMEISRSSWDRCVSEPAMMKNLTRDFMNFYHQNNERRYSGMAVMVNPEDSVIPYANRGNTIKTNASVQKARPNKLLLLCGVN